MRTDNLITAKVIADSINKHNSRLTTMVITYPRIIMKYLLSHRMLSLTTPISEDPLGKQIAKTRLNTFFPSHVENDSSSEVSEEIEERFRYEWMLGASVMCGIAETFDKFGIHKQIANRIMEPFQYVTTVVSATDLLNFFKIECNSEHYEMKALAFKMLAAYVASEPEKTNEHLPFGDKMEPGLTTEEKRMISAARCYTLGEIRDSKKDLDLANDLIKKGDYNVFEHVAMAHINGTYVGNFKGWFQLRKTLRGENVVQLDCEKLLLTRPPWI